MNDKRIIKAFAVAPLAAFTLYFFLFLFDPDPIDSIWRFFQQLGFIAAILYIVAFLLGLPAFIIVRKLKWNSLGTYIMGGLIIAVITAIILDLPHINLQRWQYYTTSSIAGILSSSLFWIIIKKEIEKNNIEHNNRVQ